MTLVQDVVTTTMQSNASEEIASEKRSEEEDAGDLFTDAPSTTTSEQATLVTSSHSMFSFGSSLDHPLQVIPIPVKTHALNLGKEDKPFSSSVTLPIPLQVFPLKQHRPVSSLNAILSPENQEDKKTSSSIKRFGLQREDSIINESRDETTTGNDEMKEGEEFVTNSFLTTKIEDEISSGEFASTTSSFSVQFRKESASLMTTSSSIDEEVLVETEVPVAEIITLQENDSKEKTSQNETASGTEITEVVKDTSEAEIDLNKEDGRKTVEEDLQKKDKDSQETTTRRTTTVEEDRTMQEDSRVALLVDEAVNPLESLTTTQATSHPQTTSKAINMNSAEDEQALTRQTDHSVTQTTQVEQGKGSEDVITLLPPKYNDYSSLTDETFSTAITALLPSLTTKMSVEDASQHSITKSTTSKPKLNSPSPVFIPEKHIEFKVPVLMYESDFANYLNRFYYSDPKVFNEFSLISRQVE